MKEKATAILIGLIIVFVVGGMIYLVIKYPREYPGYEYQYPPVYSPWPYTDSCIKNPKWCYKK